MPLVPQPISSPFIGTTPAKSPSRWWPGVKPDTKICSWHSMPTRLLTWGMLTGPQNEQGRTKLQQLTKSLLRYAKACLAIPTKPENRSDDYLTLWKEADPDIRILKQAKAEYAMLQ